jgi:hypothetical protein
MSAASNEHVILNKEPLMKVKRSWPNLRHYPGTYLEGIRKIP